MNNEVEIAISRFENGLMVRIRKTARDTNGKAVGGMTRAKACDNSKSALAYIGEVVGAMKLDGEGR